MVNVFLIVHLVVIIYMIPLNVKLSALMGTIPQNRRAHAMKVVLILPWIYMLTRIRCNACRPAQNPELKMIYNSEKDIFIMIAILKNIFVYHLVKIFLMVVNYFIMMMIIYVLLSKCPNARIILIKYIYIKSVMQHLNIIQLVINHVKTFLLRVILLK